MDALWGVLIIVAGLLMFVAGRIQSDFIIYRLMAARSRILWGDNVHMFYQIAGLLVIVFGVLVVIGIV